MNDNMAPLTLTSVTKLSSGGALPRIGLGVYQTNGSECDQAVREALKAGYRHVDSAEMYKNEEIVGKAVSDSGIPRSEVFLTTKYNPPRSVRSSEEVYQTIRKALPRIDQTGRDTAHISLMLIHAPWAGPEGRKNNWEALARAQKEGWVRDIGVSNFGIKHLETLPSPRPTLNQIEVHPWCQRRKLVEYCQKNGIAVEAYCPLTQARPDRFNEPKLLRICEKHKKEQAQVLLRWGLQKGYIVIPKSVTPSRINSNIQVYDFELDQEDMKSLDSLDLGDAGAVCWNLVDIE